MKKILITAKISEKLEKKVVFLPKNDELMDNSIKFKIKKISIGFKSNLVIWESLNNLFIFMKLYILEFNKCYTNVLLIKYKIGYVLIYLYKNNTFKMFAKIEGEDFYFKGKYKQTRNNIYLYNESIIVKIKFVIIKEEKVIEDFKYNLKESFLQDISIDFKINTVDNSLNISSTNEKGFYLKRKTY